MKTKFTTLLLLLIASYLNINAQAHLEGRWDLTVNAEEGRKAPSWLEVRHSGVNGFVGRFVADGGSARPISKVEFKEGKMSFHIPAQWERTDKELQVEGILVGDKLSGTMTATNGKVYTWVGVRAPKLWREKAPVWGKPIQLFNGKDLTGWEALGENQWIVENGVLKSPKSGSNIRSEKTFNDFCT